MCNHPDVAHLLQPLPGSASSKPDPTYGMHPYAGGGKGKTKGGKGKGLNSLPQALRDHGTAVTSQGHALCFGYFLKYCKLTVKNGRCRKGLHLCCKTRWVTIQGISKTEVSQAWIWPSGAWGANNASRKQRGSKGHCILGHRLNLEPSM